MNSNNDLLKMALSRMEGSFSPVTLSAWFDDAEAVSLEGTSCALPTNSKKRSSNLVSPPLYSRL